MAYANRIMIAIFRGITSLICRIDDAQLARVPERGPLILVTNHVNLLEIPLLYTRLQPRPVTGLVLARRWEKFWTRWLLNVGGAISLRRGEPDVGALRRATEMLEDGYIVAIAPEGTRSGDGRLQKAHAGVVSLAIHSRAPLLPVVFYGGERYVHNLLHLQRTDFHIVVGQPFYLEPGGVRVTRRVRHQMLNEVMYQLAALLLPTYRGFYADLSSATQSYLAFV